MLLDVGQLLRYGFSLCLDAGEDLVVRLVGEVARQPHLVDVLRRQEIVHLLRKVLAEDHYGGGGLLVHFRRHHVALPAGDL